MIPLTAALDLFTCDSVGQYLIITMVFVFALRLLFGQYR